ncbi:MAG: hypothetical protein GY754_16475 [bacterium]|nr:hypothetical protein [bacterium]
MTITEREYYYTIKGGNDNTLEKVLKLHGIKKSNGNSYNTKYKHDPEAWEFINKERDKNKKFLTEPVIWKGQSNEKKLKEFKIQDSDSESTRLDKKRKIRSWCKNDINPPSSHPIENFWCNEMSRYYGASTKKNDLRQPYSPGSSKNAYHLIIYSGEKIWIPDETKKTSERIRHELTDDELFNGFLPPDTDPFDSKYLLVFPVFQVRLPNVKPIPDPNTDSSSESTTDDSSSSEKIKINSDTKLTLIGKEITDSTEKIIYETTLTIDDIEDTVNEGDIYVSFDFIGTPKNNKYKYTLEIDPGPDHEGNAQEKFIAFENKRFNEIV